jgi:large subunit ribosomal protein L17|tara:strand:+ start:3899 stop:4564 length:666 start_codon:yes stop_codon:yes gene_type:complete
MRHGKKIAHLGRKTAHRKYMLANMACSLIEHKSINTTVAKAKALKRYVEPLITKSKNDSTHNRRIVFSYLKNKYAVTELFRNISEKIGERPGGYTRIVKLGNRLGDNASMAMIELVDFNSIYNLNTDSNKKTRRRKKSKPSPVETPVVEETPAVAKEAIIEETSVVAEEAVVEETPVVAEKAVVEETSDSAEKEPEDEVNNEETKKEESSDSENSDPKLDK